MAIVSALSSGCGGAERPSATTLGATTLSNVIRAPQDAIVAGAALVAEQLLNIDAASLTIGDYVFRNWGIAALSGARSAATGRMTEPSLSDDERLLARLVDPTAEFLDPTVEGAEPTTAVLAAALHCDQRPWDEAAFAAARSIAEQGGYGATHAALAAGWLRELACSPAETERFRVELVDEIAAELARATDVTDLSVEQSCVLFYLGAGERVASGWGDRVRAVQRADGGWGPTASNWHMTLLAVWTLSALDAPGAGVAMASPF